MPEILSCTSQDLLCGYIKDMNGYFVMDSTLCRILVWEIK